MINIQYTGQFGNCMFQYAFARLHAEINHINLVTHGPLELPATKLTQYTEPSKKGVVSITDEMYHKHRLQNGSSVIFLDPEYDYTFNGYFQDADIFNKHIDLVRSFFDIQYPTPSINKALVLIRLGDFIHSGYNSEIIHFNWYKNILNNLNREKIFSVTSNGLSRSPSSKEQEEKYLKEFVQEKDTFLASDKDLAKEFLEVMEYQTIICSNSTWAWWACFLSKCENIYTFKKFGCFTPINFKSHGIHINNLSNIRNVSQVTDDDFIDITQL
jgi:hypothetical protein